jgi:hypothetical protein
VQGSDKCLEARAREELGFIEQEDDACALVLGDLSKGQEQVGQVVGEVAAVGDSLQSIDVEARRERPVW